MLLNGIIIKNEDTGNFYAVEIAALNIHTQGRTKKEAYEMAIDAVETVINDKSFKADIVLKDGIYFKIKGSDDRKLFPVLLRRLREKRGFTLVDMARKLNQKSKNGYARYEQGKSMPNHKQLERVMEVLGSPLAV